MIGKVGRSDAGLTPDGTVVEFVVVVGTMAVVTVVVVPVLVGVQLAF